MAELYAPKAGSIPLAVMYIAYVAGDEIARSYIYEQLVRHHKGTISAKAKLNIAQAISVAKARLLDKGLLLKGRGPVGAVLWNKTKTYEWPEMNEETLLARESIDKVIARYANERENAMGAEGSAAIAGLAPVNEGAAPGDLRRSIVTGRVAYLFWLLSIPGTDPEKKVGLLSYKELKHLLLAQRIISQNNVNSLYTQLEHLVDDGYLVTNSLARAGRRFRWSGRYSYPHADRKVSDQWITGSELVASITSYRNGGLALAEQPIVDLSEGSSWTGAVLTRWGEESQTERVEEAPTEVVTVKKTNSFATAQSLGELIEIRDVLKEILALKKQIAKL